MRFLLAVCLVASAHGQSLPGVEPRLPEAPAVESLPPVRAAAETAPGGEVLVKRLEKVVLVAPAGGEEVDLAPGLGATNGLLVPASNKLSRRLSRWSGKPLDAGELASLADEILIHYDREGFPVVALEAPEQDLSHGVLRLTLEIGRFGEVGVSRPKYGDPAVLAKGLRLQSVELVRRADIDEQMAWYGRTAFRRPRLFVSPGLAPATADLLIAFEESRPWRANLGYENSGPDLLGRDRFLLGVAGWTPGEHLLAWQTVIGAPASSLLANALRWEIPFHTSHQVLQLDAAYAEVASRYASSGIPVESEGSSWSLAAQQRIPLPAWGGWHQRIAAGFELKGTDQFLLFGGGSLSPGEVVFFHGKLSHELSRHWEDGSATFESSVFASPGGVGGNNDDAAFQAYDPEAGSNYLIGRLSGDGWWSPGGDWQVHLRGTAQIADTRLLPAEQFAVGGYQTIRGVAEREYSADSGWQASLELQSPLVSAGKGCAFRVLGFFDHAALDMRGGPSSSLSSSGVGLRMRLAESIDVRFDHGWRLDFAEQASHVGINLTF
ncbi:BamA/TamA family outer membrane protein [Luteolibacter arcticus]|uniref:BamA/TamA family outer membrane protein n=1 Tax=Luteolibacter arcticus TaxID=1581411 RepID=A0ABT3GGW2_9BACT|nr:ShlB/FhaC/HecB family hemolysin secretion/activation protein [Luteolibacter arcticus]MCW1922819.1 BamA/TamA family outer membrane protein [Luteolibacter arcticus]